MKSNLPNAKPGPALKLSGYVNRKRFDYAQNYAIDPFCDIGRDKAALTIAKLPARFLTWFFAPAMLQCTIMFFAI